MANKTQVSAVMTGFTANKSKVEIKVKVDALNISAVEDLLNMRGRDVILTVEDTQEQLALDGEEE